MNSKRIFKWEGNKNTKKVVVPNGFTEIGRYAFKGCSSLTSITILI